MFPFTGKNLIGVDIGSYSIKIVGLKGRRNSYTLEVAAFGELSGHGNDAAELLSMLVRSHGLRGRKAASVIPSGSLTFRHMNVPEMPEKDFREAVKWEIKKEVNFPPGELISDYVVTEHDTGAEGGVPVIAFAARRTVVDETIRIFKEASLELVVMETVPTALLAAFDLNNIWEDGVSYAMLDIGVSGSTLAILKNRKLGLVREIAFGGESLTRALSSGLNKGMEESEELKLSYGLEGTDETGAQIKKILSDSLDGLASEILRSFDYYQAQFRGGTVSRLFLSGGTARLKGIDALLSKLTGTECFVDDPLRNIRVPRGFDPKWLHSTAPNLTVATGLAARKARL